MAYFTVVLIYRAGVKIVRLQPQKAALAPTPAIWLFQTRSPSGIPRRRMNFPRSGCHGLSQGGYGLEPEIFFTAPEPEIFFTAPAPAQNLRLHITANLCTYFIDLHKKFINFCFYILIRCTQIHWGTKSQVCISKFKETVAFSPKM